MWIGPRKPHKKLYIIFVSLATEYLCTCFVLFIRTRKMSLFCFLLNWCRMQTLYKTVGFLVKSCYRWICPLFDFGISFHHHIIVRTKKTKFRLFLVYMNLVNENYVFQYYNFIILSKNVLFDSYFSTNLFVQNTRYI